MEMQINVNTKIIYMDSAVPVMRAIENVKRDIRKVCCDSDEKGCDIVLIMENMQAEQFEIKCDNNMLVIYASDTLGFVYGLYHISRDILGVLPFWFWNDQVFIKKKGCRISGEYAYTSKPYAVKYRGWFVNDEVLIHKWYVDRKKDMPWEMVFEALLRCGGNLVIPGTDKNSHIYRDLAADMGLRITHHHAEPLGAPMFARRYPELTPSYDEYPEKFHELWKEGIDEQKKLDVIWNLGFRGQGDCPFWDNDPRYQTSESRGELMGKLIGLQRDYVQNEIPDAQYCTNLYGETMELYRDGYLKLPDDVIKIWADNGFGKMVTRRQGNHNPRIPALPKENNTGRHGIYYHVSFYDLQAANHITMLPNKPKLVHSELKKVLEHHVKDYWIINCSNVKPHVYYLDFIANMWRDGDVDIDKHLKGYIASYYGEDHITEIAECFRQYWQHALKYGEHEDDHAGEQFANHVARMLISQEGLPVVVNPGILDPKKFIKTVLEVRLPNPFMPDTPQRIATDTSQKLAIRFGETIKAYMASDELEASDLKLIPLVFAGWLRYLMAVDDNGNAFEPSSDPMLAELTPYLKDIKWNDEQAEKKILPILAKSEIFGVNLAEAGLLCRVVKYFKELIAGVGAVRTTLHKYVSNN